jgi:integrase
MPAIKLTARFCESVRPVTGKQLAFPDAGLKGLELRVSGDGRKIWSFRYRTSSGRQGRMTLGVFSDAYDLEKARKEAAKLRVVVDAGGDPAHVQRQAKLRAQADPIRTFDDLAIAYFEATQSGRYRASGRVKRASSLTNERKVYALHVKPLMGATRPEDITRQSVKAVLNRLLDKGVTSQANKAQAIVRQMLTYAVDELERLPFNPIVGLSPVAPERPRTHIYSEAQLKALWRGLQHPEALALPEDVAAERRDGDRVFVGPGMRIMIQLCMLLLQRRNEVAGMAIAELDLDNGVWIVPAERMKTRKPHAVPLTPYAVKLIRQAIALNDGRGTGLYVFESRAKPGQPTHGPSVNNALGNVLLALGIEDGTVHDLRRTGSTLMTSERLGVSPFIRSKVLGHVDHGGGASVSTTHYDANGYIVEKRRALEAWEGLLLKIVAEAPAAPTPEVDMPQAAAA